MMLLHEKCCKKVCVCVCVIQLEIIKQLNYFDAKPIKYIHPIHVGHPKLRMFVSLAVRVAGGSECFTLRGLPKVCQHFNIQASNKRSNSTVQ